MSKKKQQRNQLVLVIIVGVILFFFLSSSGLIDFKLFTLGIFSISEVDIIDQGRRLLIFGTVSGGDELEIVFSPQELNPFIRNQGFEATRTSILRAQYIRSDKEFRFFTTGNEIRLINGFPSGSYTSVFSVGNIQGCRNNGFPNTIAVVSDIRLFHWINNCYETIIYGETHSFTGGGTRGFVVEFDLDGETAILTGEQQSITLAGGRARVVWQGNLLGINIVNAPSAHVVQVGNTLDLIDEDASSRVDTALANFRNCAGSSGTLRSSEFNICLRNFDSVFNAQTRSLRNEYIRIEPNVRAVSFETGVMRVELGQPVFLPTFTIELDALKVGLVRLRGDPEILTCIQDQVFTQIGSLSAQADIRNRGSQDGLFEFRIECNNPEMSGGADSLDFRAGETRTVSFQLGGGNSGTSLNRARCSLRVTDRNGGGTDSCGFDFDVEHNPITGQCISGDTRCSPDGKTLFTCVNNQFQPEICPSEQICVLSGSQSLCVEDPNPSGSQNCRWWNVTCHLRGLGTYFSGLVSGFTSSLQILKGVIIVAGGFISIFLSKAYIFERIRGLRNNRGALWGISIFTGAGISLFLFVFILSPVFWFLTIGLIVGMIVLNFVPRPRRIFRRR